VAAPALQTLTSSFSEDTVHALTIAFSVLHLVSYDYKTLEDSSDASTGTLSLNASMFTAVLLASRLNNIEMVFAFMLLAVILFSFLPSISRAILQRSVGLHLVFTLFVSLFACALLYYLDFTLFIIYELWVIFISTVCPLWLMKMQIFKKALKGPWDIATL
jgi:phosphatidylinositol glycan class C protein